MELSIALIESFQWKFRGERKWMPILLKQLSEEDIVWRPTPESNSIANLVAHIWGTVHQRVEIVFRDVPDTRDREKEFEVGLVMSKSEAIRLICRSFDLLLDVLEELKSSPERLLSQPYLDMAPLTYSSLNNESTVLDVMMQMMNHLPYHTGQITYIAKMRVAELQWGT